MIQQVWDMKVTGDKISGKSILTAQTYPFEINNHIYNGTTHNEREKKNFQAIFDGKDDCRIFYENLSKSLNEIFKWHHYGCVTKIPFVNSSCKQLIPPYLDLFCNWFSFVFL